ncbi:hypothetical protein AAH995_12555 [Pseudomonas putida]|jgi:hypothetical protein|uniref:Lipoprotein n=1 Tax=Pseudomonas putida TaxID=303 RepID=A0A7Y7Z6M5_PSEPU|nr:MULTISPECIES: hypothetical protein [Pseudomonas]KAF1311208.1 hypothetical protein BLX42_10515 [Pseudomonas sp. SG-MS2]NWC78688.1 hypothetical protein [Pseudomonas putida]QPN45745.1 hypothetical protein I5S86_02255 [Priestia aryabhattai]
MLRLIMLASASLLLGGCLQEETPFPTVDLHGRLEVDHPMTTSRQAQGIEGEYFKRVLSVNGQDMAFNDFVKQYCPDSNTRNETCLKAFRIKKIDDVSGATRFLPNGL